MHDFSTPADGRVDRFKKTAFYQDFKALADFITAVHDAEFKSKPRPPRPPGLQIPPIAGHEQLEKLLTEIDSGADSERIDDLQTMFDKVNPEAGSLLVTMIYHDDDSTERHESYLEYLATDEGKGHLTTKAAKGPEKVRKATKGTGEKIYRADDAQGSTRPPKAIKATAAKPAQFLKLHEWVGRLKIGSTAKIVLAELVNHGHGRPFTWASNNTLATTTGKTVRHIRRILRSLEAAGHIAIRDYRGSWCRTGRLIFITELARQSGIDDPAGIEIPVNRSEFWKFRNQFGADSQAVLSSKCPPIDKGVKMSPRGGSKCPPKRLKEFSESKDSEKIPIPGTADACPASPKGRQASAPPGAENPEPTLHAGQECAGSRATTTGTARASRPPMNWPKENLPEVGRESALAKFIRQGRVTHIHPRWLDGLAAMVVRCRQIADGRQVYLSPKITADGWYEVTNDAALVPLIDSENYRTTKEKFTGLIHAGMIAPDQTQPVRQKTA